MKRYSAIIADRRDLSPTAIELTLKRPDGTAFPYFLPGQYATISFPGSKLLRSERSFSIASSPTYPTVLSFGIRVGGKYTQALCALKPGAQAMVAMPFGKFTFDPSRDQSAVLLAGGIGVTPFLSMIRAATAEKLPNAITLLYSVRSADDIPYCEELESLAQANPNFQYAIAISAGKKPATPIFVSGRINAELISKATGTNVRDRSYFLCGPPAFMQGMYRELHRLGVPARVVRTERFSAGSSDIIESKTLVPWFTIASWGLATAAVVGIIFKAEESKRNLVNTSTPNQVNTNTAPATNQPLTNTSTPPTTNVNNSAAPTNTVIQTNTSKVTPTNTAKTSTPTTNTAKAPATKKTVPTPVVTQPTPQPVQTAPVQPRTRVS